MCTLIVAVAPDPERALVVAANRDELLARPAEGPAPRSFGDTPAFAPLDLEAGGTWMGLSRSGLFVALTNRFGVPRHPDRRSRGQVVAEALAQPDARAAANWALALDGGAENGFHLVMADRASAHLAIADGERVRVEPLPRGEVKVVTERAFGAAPSARQRDLEARFASPITDPAALSAPALEVLLGDHEGGPFDGVCVHVPERAYGTRSAAVIELYADPDRPTRWRSADGPPCRAPFRETPPRFR